MANEKQYYVYIMTNKNNTVLYKGITNNLDIRVFQHSKWRGSKFTAKYAVSKLVYFEWYDNSDEAIKREKQIKGGSRKKKIALINSMNKEWKDLRG